MSAGGLQLAGGVGNAAVGCGAAAGRMRDHAVGGGAFRYRHLPAVGGRLHQHHPRGSAALAHVLVRLADAAAAAGGETAPHPLAGEVLPRRRVFGRDLAPVRIEFLAHQLRKSGQRALAHLGAGNADDDAVVRPDHYPGVDLRRVRGTVWAVVPATTSCALALSPTKGIEKGTTRPPRATEEPFRKLRRETAAANGAARGWGVHALLPVLVYWMFRPASFGSSPLATTLMAARTRL